MKKRISPPSVRMRPADSAHEDFYLLEELSKPRACLTAARIVIWVYRDRGAIREVVVTGHAEGRTCGSATSIIIEAASRLGANVDWMVTCGAGYFRVREDDGPSDADRARRVRELLPPGMPFDPAADLAMLERVLGLPAGESETQKTLATMVQALQERAAETGLIEIVEQEWSALEALRRRYRGRVGAREPQLVLPDAASPGRVADLVPIVPGRDPDGPPLVFALEGWDFDCPEFQAVADRHLRKVQKELLRDALRRRRTYRGWLQDWTEEWATKLKWLPKEQAAAVRLMVPPPEDSPNAQPCEADFPAFLTDHVAAFLDRGQRWPKALAGYWRDEPFGKEDDAFLDQEIHANRITVVNFGRATKEERVARKEDTGFTEREYVVAQMPSLISTCLQYIRSMDAIIKPYQDLRLWQRARRGQAPGSLDPEQQKAYLVAEVSTRIVIETMVRGWPSFYLEDKEDSEVFDRWAAACRPRVWSLMAEQAREAGTALDALLEDNVVYDVRFNDDLGCTVQPLMLVDDASHAQVHGSRLGASAAVPLWPRHGSNDMPPGILALAPANGQRAAALVQRAAEHALPAGSDPAEAARCLRAALACHPAEAARLILQEWARRLGRDTSAEFEIAQQIVCASELCRRFRAQEAGPYLERYLREEQSPVPDAYVMAAVCELAGQGDVLADMADLESRHDRLLGRLREAAGREPAEMSGPEIQSLVESHPDLLPVVRELQRLAPLAGTKRGTVDSQVQKRRELIEAALASPVSVRAQHPALARAAEAAPEALRRTLGSHCYYDPGTSEAMAIRYGDTGRIVRLRGLFDIVTGLARAEYRIGQDPGHARGEVAADMQRLAASLWVPRDAAPELKDLGEECSKGDLDRLHASLIRQGIDRVIQSCLTEMQELLSQRVVTSMPLAEVLATRIHLTQTLDAKYKTAFEMLVSAKVGLGRAISVPWAVLDRSVKDLPPGGRVTFDARRRTVALETPAGATALLRAKGATPDDVAFLRECFADPALPTRFSPFADFLAERILATEVEPGPAWRLWRDAMLAVQRELVFALGNCGSEASLMPELAPPKSQAAREASQRLDQLTPRAEPAIDWAWRDLAAWQQLLGPDPARLRDEPAPSPTGIP